MFNFVVFHIMPPKAIMRIRLFFSNASRFDHFIQYMIYFWILVVLLRKVNEDTHVHSFSST